MARAYAGFTLAQMKSVADGLSNQLAAANAELAELNRKYRKEVRTVDDLTERAEQAEAQCAAMLKEVQNILECGGKGSGLCDIEPHRCSFKQFCFGSDKAALEEKL